MASGSDGASRPAATTTGTSLTDLHTAVLRAFHAQRSWLRPLGDALGLGPGQPKLISYLANRGPSTQRDMAAYFGIDPAAVSRMLDALERHGFVESSASPADRRVKVASLTELGAKTAFRWDKSCHELEARMFRGFTPAERDGLMAMLERVRANLEKTDENVERAAHE